MYKWYRLVWIQAKYYKLNNLLEYTVYIQDHKGHKNCLWLVKQYLLYSRLSLFLLGTTTHIDNLG